MYQALVAVENGLFTMQDAVLQSSLNTLTYLLSKHYNRKVILLIDEYDVPLDKAFQAGYYDEMVALVRGMFSKTLKSNDALQFAVLTGCLRISKENIFTGFFYHGILLGLFAHMEDWLVSSNAETGDGYSDILIEIEEEHIGILMEVKYGEKGALDTGCIQALEQIEKRNYTEVLIDDGMETILKYGIACYNKRCRVMVSENTFV